MAGASSTSCVLPASAYRGECRIPAVSPAPWVRCLRRWHRSQGSGPPVDSVECATQALEKYNIEKDIAAHIKKEFDKKYNPTWHCIVGRNFGSYVTHETKHFIYFYLGQVAIQGAMQGAAPSAQSPRRPASPRGPAGRSSPLPRSAAGCGALPPGHLLC
ncbi:unnamed protein product [Nyctereutes procyonoides]|uniref:Dynein light chain n=1 Tax=Nyctereutes procyonoides TaxID=34880 RepID=A0A811YK65_NYCPR|nr:unnamed protein product [Nyctereutes procyonoides]